MDVKHQLFSACAGGDLTTLNKLLDTSQSLVSSTDDVCPPVYADRKTNPEKKLYPKA